jgi:hypothetical protein
MSGVRKQQRDPATQKLARPPLDFARGSLVYASHVRRRRNRMYIHAAALLILAVGAGFAVVLLADWLSPVLK